MLSLLKPHLAPDLSAMKKRHRFFRFDLFFWAGLVAGLWVTVLWISNVAVCRDGFWKKKKIPWRVWTILFNPEITESGTSSIKERMNTNLHDNDWLCKSLAWARLCRLNGGFEEINTNWFKNFMVWYVWRPENYWGIVWQVRWPPKALWLRGIATSLKDYLWNTSYF